MTIYSHDKFVERFRSRVDAGEPAECWEWKSRKDKDGYGLISRRMRVVKAHRVAYELATGAIPFGMLVCHHCDNPSCCNPSHLFIGSAADNNQDKIKKDRVNAAAISAGMKIGASRGDNHYSRKTPDLLARGDRHGSKTKPHSVLRGEQHPSRVHPETRPRGSDNGRAKITAEQVMAIRDNYALGVSQQQLANEFGVNQTTISRIVLRKHWSHV